MMFFLGFRKFRIKQQIWKMWSSLKLSILLFPACRHPAAGRSHEEQKAEGAGGAGPRGRSAPADDGQLPEEHRSAGQQHHHYGPGRGSAPDADDGGKVSMRRSRPLFKPPLKVCLLMVSSALLHVLQTRYRSK